jgi:hypothetical protein
VSRTNALCVAVVIVRAVRAAVVVVGCCRFVHSIAKVCWAVFKNTNRVPAT